jgi:hypothetical protein
MLKKIGICGLAISLLTFGSLAIAKDRADANLDAQLAAFHKKVEHTVKEFRRNNIDFSIFGRKGNGYVRIFTTVPEIQNTELNSEVVDSLNKHKIFRGKDVMVAKGIKCERALYKSKQDGNYVVSIGVNCK